MRLLRSDGLRLLVVLGVMFAFVYVVATSDACESRVWYDGDRCDHLDYGFASFTAPGWMPMILPPKGD
jgi:hypothetical protein